MKKGFDNEKYLKMQSEHIKERIAQFGNKLYLEFGGKLFDDYHASRVLPGFEPDSKLQMLLQLKDQAEVVIVISAEDIEENKVRGDYGITYDLDVLRLIDEFQSVGLFVGSVCLTKFAGQPSAELFQQRLKELGIKSYRHYKIPGYPSDVNHIFIQCIELIDMIFVVMIFFSLHICQSCNIIDIIIPAFIPLCLDPVSGFLK